MWEEKRVEMFEVLGLGRDGLFVGYWVIISLVVFKFKVRYCFGKWSFKFKFWFGFS